MATPESLKDVLMRSHRRLENPLSAYMESRPLLALDSSAAFWWSFECGKES
jgi:hypothetical protein